MLNNQGASFLLCVVFLMGISHAHGKGQASIRDVYIQYESRSHGSQRIDLTHSGKSMLRKVGMFKMRVAAGGETMPWLEANSPDDELVLYAFCVEFGAPIKTGSPAKYRTVKDDQFFHDPIQLEMMGRLYTLAYRELLTVENPSIRANYSAALQVAVWELLYDPETISLDTGAYQVSGEYNALVKKQANYWLSRIGTVNNVYSFTVLKSEGYQDLIVAKPAGYQFPQLGFAPLPYNGPITIVPPLSYRVVKVSEPSSNALIIGVFFIMFFFNNNRIH